MGRGNVKVELIKQRRARNLTLYKRLKGVTKKAMELSLLTGCEINMTVYDPFK